MRKLILILAFIPIPVCTEELSLHKAQELLFRNNSDIAMERKKLEKAAWDIAEANSSWYPSVDLYGNYSYFTEKNRLQYPPEFTAILPVLQKPITLGTNYRSEFGVDLSYPLFTGFSRIHNINSRKLNKELAEKSLQATRNRVSYKLGLLYLRWYFSHQHQLVRKKHLSYLEEYTRQTEILAEGGTVAAVKVVESRARLKAAQVELLESVQQSDSITRELAGLIMLDSEKIEPQRDGFDFDSIPVPSALNADRSELQMIRCNKSQLDESRKTVSAQRLPALAALAGYRVANPGLDLGGDQFMDYFIFGVQMKWNIFNGFKNRAQRMGLEKQIETLDIMESENTDFWNRSLINSNTDYYRAQEKIGASILSVKAADELVRSLEASLQAGVVTSVDYLFALNSLSQAELKLEQALLQKRTAIINALYASGADLQF